MSDQGPFWRDLHLLETHNRTGVSIRKLSNGDYTEKELMGNAIGELKQYRRMFGNLGNAEELCKELSDFRREHMTFKADYRVTFDDVWFHQNNMFAEDFINRAANGLIQDLLCSHRDMLLKLLDYKVTVDWETAQVKLTAQLKIKSNEHPTKDRTIELLDKAFAQVRNEETKTSLSYLRSMEQSLASKAELDFD